MNKKDLTFFEALAIIFGFGYVVNHNTKEIHDLSSKKTHCQLHLMSRKNKMYVSLRKALRLVNSDEYNGCYWCWNEKDNG